MKNLKGNLSHIVREWMATGQKPIHIRVTRDAPWCIAGRPKFIEQDKDGQWRELEDHVGLERALIVLGEDRETLCRLAQKRRRTVDNWFGFTPRDRVPAEVLILLEKLLDEHYAQEEGQAQELAEATL